jgi:hypothetical protein
VAGEAGEYLALRDDMRGVLSSAHAGQERPKDQVLAAAAAYFLRNLSTRPPVSTIFCLPV